MTAKGTWDGGEIEWLLFKDGSAMIYIGAILYIYGNDYIYNILSIALGFSQTINTYLKMTEEWVMLSWMIIFKLADLIIFIFDYFKCLKIHTAASNNPLEE